MHFPFAWKAECELAVIAGALGRVQVSELVENLGPFVRVEARHAATSTSTEQESGCR